MKPNISPEPAILVHDPTAVEATAICYAKKRRKTPLPLAPSAASVFSKWAIAAMNTASWGSKN